MSTPDPDRPRHRLRGAHTLPPVLCSVLLLVLVVPGLAYRPLWQDEIETAERARTILESGYPRVIDAAGTVSVNAAGRELEDGAAHRYTPWGQLYAAALGLAPARLLHFAPDGGVRFPFALAHSLASGLLAHGLARYAHLAPWPAAGIALLVGLQSQRLVYNRTARYHSLLDLLLIVGLVSLGAIRRQTRRGPLALAFTIALLPQVHSLGGGSLALTLGVLGTALLWAQPERSLAARATQIVRYVVVPGLLSLIVLIVVTRPWLQADWGRFNFGPVTRRLFSLDDQIALTYGLESAAFGALLLLLSRAVRPALTLALALAGLALVIQTLDRHPFSQTRYYMSAALLGVGWPIVFPLERRGLRHVVPLLLAATAISPELLGKYASFNGLRIPFPPYHGVHLCLDDASKALHHTEQPLGAAFRYIREHDPTDNPVLVDYVPQYVPWYLPGHRVALMPEPAARSDKNRDNPVWLQTPPMPTWHLWYPAWGYGPWWSRNRADYTIVDYRPDRPNYLLRSRRLGQSVRLCVVQTWRTDHWNNAPFVNLLPTALTPQGRPIELLVLARRCEAASP